MRYAKSMKDQFKILHYKQNYWQVADVFKNGSKVATINRDYEVTEDWILIYKTEGGTGIGFRKGELERKIFIGDAEFSKEYINEDR